MPNMLSSSIQPVEPSLFPHLTAQMTQLHLSNDVAAAPADLHPADA